MISSVESSREVDVEDEVVIVGDEDDRDETDADIELATLPPFTEVFDFPIGRYLTHQNANQTPLSITLFFRI